MLQLIPTSLPDVHELRPRVFNDDRGRFIKVFQESHFKSLGLETRFPEEYYTLSRQNVLRGLHFQLPPHDHAKLVFCLRGRAMDVAVDLRLNSPTYGQHARVELNAEHGNGIYIPQGFAHGFYSRSDETLLLYRVGSEYAPESDSGILWDSCDIRWPGSRPILSERDKSFAALKDFKSPF